MNKYAAIFSSANSVKTELSLPEQSLEHSLSNSRVTTREYGDIPGLIPAQDIFVSIPIEEMQKHTGERADKFCELLMNCDAVTFKNHPFHKTDVTLSVIKNPSKPYRHSYFG